MGLATEVSGVKAEKTLTPDLKKKSTGDSVGITAVCPNRK